VPAPSYPLFGFLADIQDVKLVHYPLVYDHGWQIDFHALQQAITPRTRAVIVVHPNNPTGHYTKLQEAARLNEICAARGLAIIADEVFLDFALGKERAASFAANAEALTFVLSGLSKISGLPQMKAAWLVTSGPHDVKAHALKRLEIIADTYLSPNAPVQHALADMLGQGHRFRAQLLARVRANLAELDRQLAAHASCGCSRLSVEAGWFAVLRVPVTRSDEDIALYLLGSRNVYVHPGHFFDFSLDGYLVVSLIAPKAEFRAGVEALLASF
jgi:aspartate/methionine/tyrosine aminotransferase